MDDSSRFSCRGPHMKGSDLWIDLLSDIGAPKLKPELRPSVMSHTVLYVSFCLAMHTVVIYPSILIIQ